MFEDCYWKSHWGVCLWKLVSALEYDFSFTCEDPEQGPAFHPTPDSWPKSLFPWPGPALLAVTESPLWLEAARSGGLG